MKHNLSEKERNYHQLQIENKTLKEQLAGSNFSQTNIQELKQQLLLKDQHIKSLEEQKKNTSNFSEFYVAYNNQRCPQEHIQELVDWLVGQITNISILNPQNKTSRNL